MIGGVLANINEHNIIKVNRRLQAKYVVTKNISIYSEACPIITTTKPYLQVKTDSTVN